MSAGHEKVGAALGPPVSSETGSSAAAAVSAAPQAERAAPQAERTTHQHLLSIALSEARQRFAPDQSVRVLDVGCGNGHLIADLHDGLRWLDPARRYTFYGFEVHDWEYYSEDLVAPAIAFLTGRAPETPWPERIASISTQDAWPYPDNSFDVIVSNQVVEHVADHDLFFREIRRTLRPGGFSVHVFPSRHTINEWHVHIPMVHWIKNAKARSAYVNLSARLGWGKYRRVHRKQGMDVGAYCQQTADFLDHYTNYKTTGELLRLSRRQGLRASFRYTTNYYQARLLGLLRRPYRAEYRRPALLPLEGVSVGLLKHLANVTLFLDHDA